MQLERLFHFSEEFGIPLFEPRPPSRHPHSAPLVYAIDAWHSPMYFLPRNCPRVVTFSAANFMVIAIQDEFLSDVKGTQLARYHFLSEGFLDCNDHGVYVSPKIVKPIAVERVGDLLNAIAHSHAELLTVLDLGLYWREQSEIPHQHVSAIRLSLLPNWKGTVGKPVFYQSK